MSKTPVKSPDSNHSFSTRELPTPNKDSSGISKTVFTHLSNLHALLSSWTRAQEKGTKLCKTISALKLHECTEDYYPQQLKPLTESLLEALESLKNIVEGAQFITNQLQALSRLQPTDQAVISSWSTSRISDTVYQLYQSLQQEYQLKQVVTENIAHYRDENMIEVCVSSWEFDAYCDLESSSYLFAEVGLPSIT